MNKLCWKIAVLVGCVVLVLMLIVTVTFNIIVRKRMRHNAEEALNYAFVVDVSDITDLPMYQPEVILLFEDTEENLLYPNYTQKEKSIIKWCSDIETDTIKQADIGDNSYYVLFRDSDELFSETYVFGFDDSIDIDDEAFNDTAIESDTYTFQEGDPDLIGQYDTSGSYKGMIAYIDITGEIGMIRRINIVFLISAVIIGALGSAAGYYTGKKLEQNQLAQKQFFENTSHELKTPLTSIRGYAEGIETGVITDYKRTGRTIAAQTEKMSRLVEEILCMAKIESGSVSLEREDIELSGFIQDCLMPFEGTVLSRGLEVSLDLMPTTVAADPDKLEHAISNLLTNALKYARTKISVSCGSGGFCISNDCEPLSDDTLSHLFERFYTGRDGNTGIGLSLAKDLIELHGWQITARRTEDGVCFDVRCSKTARRK
ncbi:MAG: HAMP domain-containing histidine kinase [Ruminococcus sp.]|nr:HAMP domain-containing histidine kinase [Ruminococcus sp.]